MHKSNPNRTHRPNKSNKRQTIAIFNTSTTPLTLYPNPCAILACPVSVAQVNILGFTDLKAFSFIWHNTSAMTIRPISDNDV